MTGLTEEETGKRKAQVSVELFLGLTLFLLVLYWMNHFVATQRDSSTAFVDQEKLVAASLAQIANSVCAANTSVDYSLPCLYADGQNANYSVSTSIDNVIQIIPELEGAPWMRQAALCNFSASSVRARCARVAGENSAGTVCMNLSFDAGVRRVGIWSGAC